jgi:preprotein translocase subunit SecG
MYTLFSILIMMTCLLLILVVMVQNPKGGGLSSAFGSSNQVMGVKKTTDFLDKATWTLAAALVALTLLSNIAIERNTIQGGNSQISEQLEEGGLVLPEQSAPLTTPVATEELPQGTENVPTSAE